MASRGRASSTRWLVTLQRIQCGLGEDWGSGRQPERPQPGAFWASWADALHMIDKRLPALSRTVVREGGSGQCFRRFWTEAVLLHDQHGKSCARARDLLFLLSAPNQVTGSMAGSTTRLPLPNSTFGRRWYLLSRSLLTRLTCALILAQLPARCCTELHQDLSFKLAPDLFQTLVLERMRLPLQVSEAHCECRLPLDVQGRHRAACPRSGRLKSRAQAPDRTLARVCCEAECHSALQRNVAGHEHCSGSNRSPCHRSFHSITVFFWPWTSPFGALTQRSLEHAPLPRPRTEPFCKLRVHRRPQNMPNSCMGTVAVWLWSAWRRAGDGVEAMQFVGGLQGQGSTSSDAVQHVLGLATALDEDDRQLLRTGGRSFTGLVEGEHSRV